MKNQIKNIFLNALKGRKDVRQQFNEEENNMQGGDDGKIDQIASLVKNLPNTNGTLDNGTRSELIKLTTETMLGIDELKKAYLHRKILLNKIAGEISANAAQDEKSALKAHVIEMMKRIDERIGKFDEEKSNLEKESALIKNKQV